MAGQQVARMVAPPTYQGDTGGPLAGRNTPEGGTDGKAWRDFLAVAAEYLATVLNDYGVPEVLAEKGYYR